MSSINNGKNLANLPQLPMGTDGAGLPQGTQAAQTAPLSPIEEAEAAQETNIAALAMMGLAPANGASVGRTDASNKYALAATLTSVPPPLPNDRAPITADTQALFTSMNADIDSVMGKVRPTETQAAEAMGQGAVGNAPKTNPAEALQALANMTDAEAGTPAGQTKINTAIAQVVGRNALDMSVMTGADMMAAFMLLQVRNEASGKEIEGTLMDLTADARKTAIDQQMSHNKAALEKVQEAHKKQKALAFLAPLIEAIMAIATVVLSVMTAGSATALMVMAAAAVIGFVVGGAVGGSKKGTGFDLGSAFMGMGIGASVGAVGAKLIMTAITKMLSMLASRAGTGAIAKVSEQAASGAAKFGSRNLSNRASAAVNGTAIGLQAAGQVAKAGMQYDYEKTLADAKEQQAKALMMKALADAMQNQYQALSTTISGIVERRNAGVNQMMSMLKAHQAVASKTVSQFSG